MASKTVSSITLEDIKNTMISEDNSKIIIGDIVFPMRSAHLSAEFWNALTVYAEEENAIRNETLREWVCRAVDDFDVTPRPVEEADYLDARDMCEHFRAAIDSVIFSGIRDYGKQARAVHDDDNMFISSVYSMQDSLYYSVEDCGLDADDETLFERFRIDLTSLLWISDFYGTECLMNLLHYFFDNYLLIIRKAASETSDILPGFER